MKRYTWTIALVASLLSGATLEASGQTCNKPGQRTSLDKAFRSVPSQYIGKGLYQEDVCSSDVPAGKHFYLIWYEEDDGSVAYVGLFYELPATNFFSAAWFSEPLRGTPTAIRNVRDAIWHLTLTDWKRRIYHSLIFKEGGKKKLWYEAGDLRLPEEPLED
ncbi:MAG: hypothetical protein V1821_03490 [bacterium]